MPKPAAKKKPVTSTKSTKVATNTAPKKAAPKTTLGSPRRGKAAPKKAAPKKAAPKKAAPKKAAPQKATPKKASPKKTAPKTTLGSPRRGKAAPKKTAPKTTLGSPRRGKAPKKATPKKTTRATAKPATPAAIAKELRALLEGEDGAAIHAKGVELFSAITQGTRGEAHLGLIAIAFSRAGELGHAEAWVDFGRCLWNGWGVETDEDAALAAYEKAASMGSDQGAYALAMNAYWHREDFAAAQTWAKQALRGGDPVGAVHYLLGLMAFHGQGTEEDKKKSYALHEKAAKRGDADAMFELFAMASTGQGTKKNEAKAVVWLMEAAKRNHPRALANLGAFHAMGSFGFAQDLEASASCYEAASEAGHGRASATLGAMYLGGQGVRRNDKRAAEFFARAEAQGFDVQEFLEGLG